MPQKLLSLLADGQFHSGEILGQRLTLSRAAIWKQIQQLRAMDLEIMSVTGKGYKIEGGLDLLQAGQMTQFLSADVRRQLATLEVFLSLDSTNSYLLRKSSKSDEMAHVCFAEYQSAGRGRRGRQWVSPLASNLYLSIARQFRFGMAAMDGLSLVIAVAMIRALESLNVAPLMLKWPNDIQLDGKKLAGVLIEIQGEADGPCYCVIGIGLNVRMPEQAHQAIDQPWTDLHQYTGTALDRNQLAASLLQSLLPALAQFEQQGLAPFLADWHAHDACLDRELTLIQPSQSIRGIGRGIQSDGSLLVESEGVLQAHRFGEVSVRINS